MPNITSLAALAIGLSAALVATPSSAQPEARSVTIRTADLDLATPAGQQALHGRVAHAVSWVCGPLDPRDLRGLAATRACRAASLARALQKMQTVVDAAHSGRGYAADNTMVVPSGY